MTSLQMIRPVFRIPVIRLALPLLPLMRAFIWRRTMVDVLSEILCVRHHDGSRHGVHDMGVQRRRFGRGHSRRRGVHIAFTRSWATSCSTPKCLANVTRKEIMRSRLPWDHRLTQSSRPLSASIARFRLKELTSGAPENKEE